MIPELEIPLAFNGNQWIADLGDDRIYAPELNQLEDRITEAVRRMPRYASHTMVHVWLAFDFDSMPLWLRQYHAHYFNNRLTVSIPMSGQSIIPPG